MFAEQAGAARGLNAKFEKILLPGTRTDSDVALAVAVLVDQVVRACPKVVHVP